MTTNPKTPKFELPALNPWTRIVRLRNDRLRLVTASREMIDLSKSDSRDVSAACKRLSWHWPTTKIMTSPAAGRGLLLLNQLGQLIDSQLLRFSDDSQEQAQVGQALTRAALSARQAATATPPATPDPLPPTVGVLASAWWVPRIVGALRLLGINQISTPTSSQPWDYRERHSMTDVSLVILVGELDWQIANQLMRRRISHLLITPCAAAVEVSPVVTPGKSACLRCVHLARSESDPHWATVAEALAGRSQPPIDPVLASIAAQQAAAATHDWVHAQGPTRSVVRRILAPHGVTTTLPLTPHPLCPSCCDLQPVSDPKQAPLTRAA